MTSLGLGSWAKMNWDPYCAYCPVIWNSSYVLSSNNHKLPYDCDVIDMVGCGNTSSAKQTSFTESESFFSWRSWKFLPGAVQSERPNVNKSGPSTGQKCCYQFEFVSLTEYQHGLRLGVLVDESRHNARVVSRHVCTELLDLQSSIFLKGILWKI